MIQKKIVPLQSDKIYTLDEMMGILKKDEQRDVSQSVSKMSLSCELMYALETHTDEVTSLAWYGTLVASGSLDKTVHVFDILNPTLKQYRFEGHTAPVGTVAFQKKGTWIVSGCNDHYVRQWKFGLDDPILKHKQHSNRVPAVACSPQETYAGDSKYIASGSMDSNICLWEVGNHRNPSQFLKGNRAVYALAFSKSGKYLISGLSDGAINMWDVENKTIITTLHDHKQPVCSIAFSPDGKYFASGSLDRTVKVWEFKTGHVVYTMEEHTDLVNCVSYSYDGKYLASCSHDKTIKLWEVGTKNVLTLPRNGTAICAVAFSSCGKYLASGGSDRWVTLWKVSYGY